MKLSWALNVFLHIVRLQTPEDRAASTIIPCVAHDALSGAKVCEGWTATQMPAYDIRCARLGALADADVVVEMPAASSSLSATWSWNKVQSHVSKFLSDVTCVSQLHDTPLSQPACEKRSHTPRSANKVSRNTVPTSNTSPPWREARVTLPSKATRPYGEIALVVAVLSPGPTFPTPLDGLAFELVGIPSSRLILPYNATGMPTGGDARWWRGGVTRDGDAITLRVWSSLQMASWGSRSAHLSDPGNLWVER